jgi:hypothetical protein
MGINSRPDMAGAMNKKIPERQHDQDEGKYIAEIILLKPSKKKLP